MKVKIKELLQGIVAFLIFFLSLTVFMYILVEGTGEWYRTCITTKVC